MTTPSEISTSNPSMDDPDSAPVFPTEIFSQIIHHVALSRRPGYRDPNSPAASDERWQMRHPFFRLQNLRLVSRAFNALSSDYLFDHLFGYAGHGRQHDLWRALADGSTCLGSSVRGIHITLGWFSPEREQMKLRVQQEIELLKLIACAIPKLPLLAEATINLDFYRRASRRSSQQPILTGRHLACLESILVGIANLPRVPLRSLSINRSDYCCGFPSVGGFTKLKRLTIQNPLDADMVATLIADNPHLSALTISGHFLFSISDVLPSLPPDADHHLKTLSLEQLTFIRDDVPLLVPFIKEVKRLAFCCMLDIPDDLWVELTQRNTPLNSVLKSLSIYKCEMYPTESFIDFISSCSILERLNFTFSQFDYEASGVAASTSVGIAHRFWIDALPRLAGSLRELHLLGPANSGLCIQNVKYVDALSECHLLEMLRVAVNTNLAMASETRKLIHRILTTLCQNSWPVMRELYLNSCPMIYTTESLTSRRSREGLNLLLHNTEFETSTEHGYWHLGGRPWSAYKWR